MLLTGAVATGLAALTISCLGAALSIDTKSIQSRGRAVQGRADPSLAGYLGVFFLGSDPYVYFYLSNGNNPLSLKALNKGSPIMKPTKGTGGVRDPAIVRGGGDEAGRKWYIVGTDLDIGKVRERGRKKIEARN